MDPSAMDPSLFADINVEDLFGGNNNPQTTESRESQPFTEAPLQSEQITTEAPLESKHQITTENTVNSDTNPLSEPKAEEKSVPTERTEEKAPFKQEPITEEKTENIEDEMESEMDIDLPNVDSLQPNELCISIQETIDKISQFDANRHPRLIMIYKDNLIQQLEKLQNISAAIDSLNNLQSTAESLPKNEKTGYPNIYAINSALREHCFFAEQINVFGMLLIEICDIDKIKEKHSSQHCNILLQKMCETIDTEFVYEHLLFHYSAHRLVALVYIENEKELMICGKEIIRLLTSHSYEIRDQILHSTISIGCAIYDNRGNHRDNFDFRTWLKNAELGLNKANNSGLTNQCGMSKGKETDIINVISVNTQNTEVHKHSKSTLSLLVRTRDRGHSSASSYNKLRLNEMTTKLTPKEMRASIRLYDKLYRINNNSNANKDNNYKLIALSLCRRLKDDGANYNFQHPKYNGNSILMLCCTNNIDIIIKYFCIKLNEEINFNAVNNDGNNALMIALMNANVTDDIVKLVAAKTTDKLIMNHEGQTAQQLAQKMNRNDLIALLQ